MIGNVIQAQFGASNDWPFGSALSFVLMFLTFIVLFGQWAFQRRSKGVGAADGSTTETGCWPARIRQAPLAADPVRRNDFCALPADLRADRLFLQPAEPWRRVAGLHAGELSKGLEQPVDL